MKFCIMHIKSSFLRIFFSKKLLQEFLYGVLLVQSRCCFHHLVENSILYKRDIQHFCIGPKHFSENKIIRSVVGGKVDGQILFGTRSEKRKIYLAPNDSFENFYLAVKGLRHDHYRVIIRHNCNFNS